MIPAEPIVKLDLPHPAFECVIPSCNSNDKKFCTPPQFLYNFKKANYSAMNEFLVGVDWSFCEQLPFDEAIIKFYSILENAISLHVPFTRDISSSFPKWFDKDLVRLVKDKNFAHARYKFSNLYHLITIYIRNLEGNVN